MEMNSEKNIKQKKFFRLNNKLAFMLVSILVGFLVGAIVFKVYLGDREI